MPHTSLRSEMNDDVYLFVIEKDRLDALPLGEVRAVEGEPRHGPQQLQPRLFQSNVVVVVEIVDADHTVAAFQQSPCDVRTDEASRSSDQGEHRYSGRATRRSSSSSSTAWPSAMWHSWIRAVSWSGTSKT